MRLREQFLRLGARYFPQGVPYRKLLWLSILYFAQGMPFGVFQDVLPVYLRQHEVSLKEIGMMAILTMPWTIKPLWAPLLDRYGDRRVWIAACSLGLSAAMFCLPLFDASHPEFAFWALLLMFTLSSATQDIAIDAFSVDIAAKGEEGLINSFRSGAYRVGVLAAGGATMYLVAPFGWTWVYLALALGFAAMAIAALAAPKVKIVHQPAREWVQSFLAFLVRPGSLAIFAFVLLYKIGDIVMGPMVKPFWTDRGMTPAEIATISTNAGMVLAILGAIVGGLFTIRFGIFHALWALGLGQGLSNLLYAAVAQYNLGRPWLYSASMFESFTQGLATTAFLSFLMRICDKRQAATQYALLTALYALPRSTLAPFGGAAAEHFGYAAFFAMTAALALPAYALLPWVRRWIGVNGRGRSGAGGDLLEGAGEIDPGAPAGPAGAPARASRQNPASATVR